MAEIQWRDIVNEQPEQGQRVLVRIIGGAVRLTSYDKFNYEHWCIKAWKPVPEKQDGQGI
jgi:hypothetical protein